jgi:NAD(P)-dependent dehydrogenase (short-subunit alcohol dehydrogenase family)
MSESKSNGDRAIFVVGASGGIGAAIARALLQRGVRVVGSSRARTLATPSGHPMILLDLRDPSSIRSAPERFERAAGGPGIDGLVCAAGIAAIGSVEGTSAVVFEEILAVNVTGTAAVCQAFLPMLRASGGRIVILGSLSSRGPQPFQAAYAASKAAVAAWASALRAEVQALGVEVILVEPGAVTTRMKRALDLPAADVEHGSPYRRTAIRRLRAIRQGLERGVEPERVAVAIADAILTPRPPARIVVEARPVRSAIRRAMAAGRRQLWRSSRPPGSAGERA